MASEKGLINKQDVIRHLRGDCIGKYPLSYYFGLLAAAGEVEIMPTVDAVPVVRCKDCKHYVIQACACRHDNFNGIISMDGFCSYGLSKLGGRKTDGV